jgi:hypothetical protein
VRRDSADVIFFFPGERENRRLMVWTPARLYRTSQWTKDLLRNIRKSEEGPGWKLQRSGSTLAKSEFVACGADSRGRVVMRRQLRRAQILNFMRRLPRCVVALEASGGAQYWARQLTALEVRAMSPALVMP